MTINAIDQKVKIHFTYCRELLDWYFENHIMVSATVKTQNVMRGTVKRLKFHFGDIPVEDLDQIHVEDYKQIRAAGGIGMKPSKGTSTSYEIRMLMAAIRRGIAKRKLPMSCHPVIEAGDGPAARERFLSRKEAAQVLKAAKRHRVKRDGQRPRMTQTEMFAWLALYSGQRRDAIKNLHWVLQVDFARQEIQFQPRDAAITKKRNAKQYIHPALYRAMRRFYHDRLDKGPTVFTKWFNPNEACQKLANLSGVKGVTPHVFRHTFISWRLAAGCDVFYVASAVGSTPSTIWKSYAHIMPATNKRVMMQAKEQRISGGRI